MKYGRAVLGGGAFAIVAVVAGGWLFGVQPLLSSATASELELQSVRLLNQLQSERLAELDAQGEAVADVRESFAGLDTAIPSDEAMADFLGELGRIEQQTGARVTTLTASPMTSLTGGATAGTDSAPATGATTGEATGEAGAPADASDAVASSGAVGVPGLMALPVSLSAVGAAQSVADFVEALQRDGRYLSLSSIAMSSDPATGANRVDLVGTAYVLPTAG